MQAITPTTYAAAQVLPSYKEATSRKRKYELSDSSLAQPPKHPSSENRLYTPNTLPITLTIHTPLYGKTSLTLLNFIAAGTFGKAYKSIATYNDDSEQPCITKCFFKKDAFESETNKYTELNKLNIPREHVIQTLFAYVGKTIRISAIIFEDGGICLAKINACNKEKIPDIPLILNLGIQLYTGLAALNSRYVIHADISRTNLVVKQGILKIIDFGSALLANKETGKASLEPEIQITAIDFRGPDRNLFGQIDCHKYDCWSAGVVLHFLLTPIKRNFTFYNVSNDPIKIQDQQQLELLISQLGKPPIPIEESFLYRRSPWEITREQPLDEPASAQAVVSHPMPRWKMQLGLSPFLPFLSRVFCYPEQRYTTAEALQALQDLQISLSQGPSNAVVDGDSIQVATE